MSSGIHETAVIAEGASIGEGNNIGPFTVIGPKVVIGKGNRIGPHVVIEGNTTIGDENRIFQFASVGADPQDLKYQGEESELKIGDKNIIREYATLQPGTKGGGMVTTVGDENLFMACSHLGHDCHLGSRNVIANSVGISGHVTVGDGVILGGLAAVHQFVRIGSYSLISGGSMVVMDVPPYCLAQGDRAHLAGINTEGLKRNGFTPVEIAAVKKLYRKLFLEGENFRKQLELIENTGGESTLVSAFIDFIKNSERGISIPRKKGR